MEEMNIYLSNKLKEYRVKNQMKQEIVAQEIGISQQAYSQLEQGKLNFTPKIVKKIINFFSITIAEFFSEKQNIHIFNSPQGYMNNGTFNDNEVVRELIKSKDELISMYKNLLTDKDLQLQNLEKKLYELKKK